MDTTAMGNQLTRGAHALEKLARGVDTGQARWKPTANKWSLLEVVNHMYDEEREDFRLRLDLVLHHPDATLPPIDPERWAVDRRYNDRDLDESLDRFLAERQRSIQWLAALRSPDWQRTYQLPSGTAMRAGDFMLSWLAHDLLHARQIVGLHFCFTTENGKPYSPRYAGTW